MDEALLPGARAAPPERPGLVARASRWGERVVASAVICFIIVVMTYSFAGALVAGDAALESASAVFVSACMLSQVTGALVHSSVSTVPFIIAGPYASVANILAALVSKMAADLHEEAIWLPTALACFGILALVSGLIQVVLAHPRVRLGKAAAFMPLPVILGLLLAIAIVLVVGGMQVGAGLSLVRFSPVGATQLVPPPEDGALVRRALAQALCALGLGVTLWASNMAVGGNSIGVTAAVLLGGVGLFYALGALLVGTGAAGGAGLVETLRLYGWLGKAHVAAAGGPLGGALASVRALCSGILSGRVQWAYLLGSAQSPLQALPVYVLVHTLVVLSTLPLLTSLPRGADRLGVDADTELRASGLSSMLQGALGAPSCAYLLTATMQHRDMAGDRAGGYTVAALCALCWLFGGPIASLAPRYLLGGLYVHFGISMAASMLYRPGLGGRDLLVLLGTAAAYVCLGAMAGLLVGLVATCLDFVLVQAQLSAANLVDSVEWEEHSERKRRNSATVRTRYTVTMRLRGTLFFGSTSWLSAEVLRTVAEYPPHAIGTFVLDFDEVASLDVSAIECVAGLASELGVRAWHLRCTGLHSALREKFLLRGLDASGAGGGLGSASASPTRRADDGTPLPTDDGMALPPAAGGALSPRRTVVACAASCAASISSSPAGGGGAILANDSIGADLDAIVRDARAAEVGAGGGAAGAGGAEGAQPAYFCCATTDAPAPPHSPPRH